MELFVTQMEPEGEAQPDLGRREAKQESTHVSLGPIGKILTGQAGGVMQGMPVSICMHSEQTQCALHNQ